MHSKQFFLVAGNESMSTALRKKCGYELVNNLNEYYDHPHLENICKKTGISKSILMHTLLGNDAMSKWIIRLSFQYETYNMNRWCAMLHVFTLSTVLRKNIVSVRVFPNVPTVYRSLVHGIISPLAGVPESSEKPIVILWTWEGNFYSTPGAVYVPNHVVPLMSDFLKYSQKRHSTRTTSVKGSSNTKQVKMQTFFYNSDSIPISFPWMI